MKKLKLFILPILSILLSGCIQPYVANPTSPHAQFTIFKRDGFFTDASFFNAFSDYKTCQIELGGKKTNVPLTINAEQPITIFIMHFFGSKRINYTITFYPKKDHVYVGAWSSDQVYGKESVIFKIYDKTNDNSSTPMVLRKSDPDMFFGYYCKADDSDYDKAEKVEEIYTPLDGT